MEVKPHVILFLDILGYKNLIMNASQKSENDYLREVHSLMATLSSFIENRNQQLDSLDEFDLKMSSFKSLVFSDNIMFFAPYTSEIDMLNLSGNLIYGLCEFLFQYPKGELFFRGAVTAGSLYYDENLHFVFGSGLIRAYELEQTEAKYPRIIIDNCLKPSNILVGWTQDSEEKWYIDYLTLAYARLCDDQNGVPPMTKEKALFHLREHKESIQLALIKYQENEEVYPKYKWLAEYHNRFCHDSKLEELTIQV